MHHYNKCHSWHLLRMSKNNIQEQIKSFYPVISSIFLRKWQDTNSWSVPECNFLWHLEQMPCPFVVFDSKCKRGVSSFNPTFPCAEIQIEPAPLTSPDTPRASTTRSAWATRGWRRPREERRSQPGPIHASEIEREYEMQSQREANLLCLLESR
jgi:hypothetical protein